MRKIFIGGFLLVVFLIFLAAAVLIMVSAKTGKVTVEVINHTGGPIQHLAVNGKSVSGVLAPRTSKTASPEIIGESDIQITYISESLGSRQCNLDMYLDTGYGAKVNIVLFKGYADYGAAIWSTFLDALDPFVLGGRALCRITGIRSVPPDEKEAESDGG